MRGRKDKPRDRVASPGQLERVGSPDGEIGAAAWPDGAEVAAGQEGGAGAGGQAEKFKP